MTIQDIYNYSGYYKESYGNLIQNVSTEFEQKEVLATGSVKAELPLHLEEKKAPKSADLENISLTFNSVDSFSYIGRDRSVENLDVMQAVSDMQKDAILHQYHTFVSMDEPVFRSEDGMVFLKW